VKIYKRVSKAEPSKKTNISHKSASKETTKKVTGLISSSLTNSGVMNCDQSFWPIWLATKTKGETEREAKKVQSVVQKTEE